MPVPVYDQATFHQMLTAAFSTGEINTLAFELFPKIYDDFSSGMSKSDRIKQIIEAAGKNGRFPHLITYVKNHNPHQYHQFKNRLQKEEIATSSTTQLSGWQQRKNDLEEHITKDLKLLKEFDDVLRAETHPQRRLGYQQDIKRQQEALANRRQELEQLEGEITNQAEPEGVTNQQLLAEIQLLKQTIVTQHDDLSAQLITLSAGQKTIMGHIDENHQQTLFTVVKQLTDNQQEVVEIMLTAAERQQIAYQEATDLTDLTHQVLTHLEAQPNSDYWKTLLAAVEEPASLTQKLKLVLPLIPGILEYETELAVDGMGWLKELWQKVTARFQNK